MYYPHGFSISSSHQARPRRLGNKTELRVVDQAAVVWVSALPPRFCGPLCLKLADTGLTTYSRQAIRDPLRACVTNYFPEAFPCWFVPMWRFCPV